MAWCGLSLSLSVCVGSSLRSSLPLAKSQRHQTRQTSVTPSQRGHTKEPAKNISAPQEQTLRFFDEGRKPNGSCCALLRVREGGGGGTNEAERGAKAVTRTGTPQVSTHTHISTRAAVSFIAMIRPLLPSPLSPLSSVLSCPVFLSAL